MIAFSEMLVGPAEEAGIPVPSNPEDFDVEKFSRWNLFLCAQLGQPMPSPVAHWENAKVIAAIPEKKLKKITWKQLEKLGFQVGYAMP